MAAEEFSPQDMGFQSDQDMQDIFERNKAFGDELETQTVARLKWMLTRQRAAFLILARELDLDSETAAKLSSAQSVLARELADFVLVGIDEEQAVPAPQHPLDESLNDLVDSITEPRGYTHAVEMLGPVRTLMDNLLLGSDEDLLHRLVQLRNSEEI